MPSIVFSRPPSRFDASKSVTSCPRRAAMSAASHPAGPPPMTASFFGVSGFGAAMRSALCSMPQTGLTEQTVFHFSGPGMWHLLQRRHGTTSSARPSYALTPHSGSAMNARAAPMKSA